MAQPSGSGAYKLPQDGHAAPLLAGGAALSGPAKAAPTVKQPRKWLTVNAAGEASTLELSKLRVTHDMGVQLRDLRLLDPLLAASYPSAILARERALVVNLEFIKMIVGLERVFITNLEDPNTELFVEELQARTAHPPGSTADLGISPAVTGLEAARSQGPAVKAASPPPPATWHSQLGGGSLPLPPHPELPFELRVLECALDVVSSHLERQTSELEATAHPALDALTQQISTDSLERVRRVKNRMVRLATRVETLKEVLEKLLDDDSDMKDLNLSAKEADREEVLNRHAMRSTPAAGMPFDVPLRSAHSTYPDDLMTPKSGPSFPSTVSTSLEDDEDVAVVEMLLEPYFMQVDNTWNKLQTLTGYIDDTEDFINIELDSKRNRLIRLDLLLTAFLASVGLITAITGLFAMNTVLYPGITDKVDYTWFVVIATSSAALAIGLFTTVVVYARRKKLI